MALDVVNTKPITSRTPKWAKSHARSRVTNGRELLPGIDGRSLWARRYRDVLTLHLSDLGGADNVSEAEKAIARRAACLIVELEQIEVRFARGDEPEGEDETGNMLDRYQRCANTLRRLLESLGLQRRAKDVKLIEHDADERFRQQILDVLKDDDNEQEQEEAT
jgi:hypothetical protein